MTDDLQNVQTAERWRKESLADMIAVSDEPSLRQSFPLQTLIKVLLLVGIVVAMNYRQFPLLIRKWMDDQNWSHGFIIPLFSLWLVYARRNELVSVRRRVCLWGLPVLLAACVLQILACWIQNPWSCQVSMVLVVFALVFYLAGVKMIRIAWLPILFLLFALPIPDIIYGRIAFPLQNLAALGSGIILNLFGGNVEVSASYMNVQTIGGKWEPLAIEEACSGMRLLMAFMALSVAMAYLENRPLWQRAFVVLTGVPVAIFCNVVRVTITGAMFIWEKPAFGQKFMHEFTGMLMLIPAFVLLWLVGKLLGALYVEEDEEERPSEKGEQAYSARGDTA